MSLFKKYRKYMSIPKHTKEISLSEGNTPLIPLPKLSSQLGKNVAVYAKVEGQNPTGSFKDRGMTIAVGEAVGRGAETVICASTGNTAASAAAYAARAGIRAIVLIPEGKVASGKLAGALAYGALLIQVRGSFDDALSMVVQISDSHPLALVNSINPFRIEGQITAAFEICNQLGSAPDWLSLPVGNAGNITAYWKGFKQWDQENNTGLPKLLGVQAAGAAPLVKGMEINDPETKASAIRIGKPARGEEALLAAIESDGRIIACSDEEIFAMQSQLAHEGIWVEPASAAGAAGLRKEIEEGQLDPEGKRFVIVCTGHGLKDPAAVSERHLDIPIIPAEIEALEKLVRNKS
jgi:threonine synthase